MKFFSDIVNGLKWVGKELAGVTSWIPKVVKIVDDVDEDAAQLLPQVVTVFEDVDGLVVAAVKDGGSCITAAEALTAAIITAATLDALNIASDMAVAAAFETFIDEVKSKGTWTDVLTALKKLTTDWDTFGANAKAAIAKLEADA